MKKLVLSLAIVLGATFAFAQELSKEELKEQKRQIKALMGVVNDAEVNLNTDPIGASNALKPVLANSLVNKDAYVWFVSASAKQAPASFMTSKMVAFPSRIPYVHSSPRFIIVLSASIHSPSPPFIMQYSLMDGTLSFNSNL